MSLAEVLTAARSLPREEQLLLARTLADEPQATASVTDLPPFFQEWVASGQPLDIQWPVEAPEAASELLRLLHQGREG
jgi:hypothetical protein